LQKARSAFLDAARSMRLSAPPALNGASLEVFGGVVVVTLQAFEGFGDARFTFFVVVLRLVRAGTAVASDVRLGKTAQQELCASRSGLFFDVRRDKSVNPRTITKL
jgi:hypothetical protein